jgi:hypothetical protein
LLDDGRGLLRLKFSFAGRFFGEIFLDPSRTIADKFHFFSRRMLLVDEFSFGVLVTMEAAGLVSVTVDIFSD